jgi:hypothetical protein
MSPPLLLSPRLQALVPERDDDHQKPTMPTKKKPPLLFRRPPGPAVKPEEFVAPVLGEFQPPGVG